MTEQDSTPTDRELLESVDPLTLEIPILLTLDEWATVLSSLEFLAITGDDPDIRARTMDAATDVRQQMFDKLDNVKSALLETGELYQYHVLLIEKP